MPPRCESFLRHAFAVRFSTFPLPRFSLRFLRPAKLSFSVPFPFISTSRLAYAPLYWSWPLRHGSIQRLSVSAHCLSGPSCANASQCHSGALPCVSMPMPGPARQLSTLPLHVSSAPCLCISSRYCAFSPLFTLTHCWAFASPSKLPHSIANQLDSSLGYTVALLLHLRFAPADPVRAIPSNSHAQLCRSIPCLSRSAQFISEAYLV